MRMRGLRRVGFRFLVCSWSGTGSGEDDGICSTIRRSCGVHESSSRARRVVTCSRKKAAARRTTSNSALLGTAVPGSSA